jgi:hypothetical protein
MLLLLKLRYVFNKCLVNKSDNGKGGGGEGVNKDKTLLIQQQSQGQRKSISRSPLSPDAAFSNQPPALPLDCLLQLYLTSC